MRLIAVTTMSKQGKVQVPEEIREHLKINRKRAKILWYLDDGKAVMEVRG